MVILGKGVEQGENKSNYFRILDVRMCLLNCDNYLMKSMSIRM